MKSSALLLGWVSAAAVLACDRDACAASTFYFNAAQQYTSLESSPFYGSSVHLERFEDGLLNVGGVTANGFIKPASAMTDSVDRDDGTVDGFGHGQSYSSGFKNSITFTFSQNAQGKMPTMAGLVWTDGHANSTITFRAWDKFGTFLGKIQATLGDAMRNGTTAEDRFFGVKSTTGISRIEIVSNFAGFEIDHLQFSYYSFAVVPVPPALALGAAGLGGVAVFRRIRRGRLP